jgi:FKBP-type peptidyl-prolyl cis-trans isomerase FklB
MKLTVRHALVLAGWMAFSAPAQQSPPVSSPQAPTREKLSYALGMNLGEQLKRDGMEVDIDTIVAALNDVLVGRPTEVKETEIRRILKQAEVMCRMKQSSKNIAEGEAFLAKNATASGVTVLPDGLQYRVLKTGTGDSPKMSQILTLKFKGTWLNGTEFKHNDRLEVPLFACPKGLREALQAMKVGSEWQVYIPYTLAYGHLGEEAQGFGSTLVYDVELFAAESETAHPNKHHSAGRLGHTLDEDLLPAKFRASVGGGPTGNP